MLSPFLHSGFRPMARALNFCAPEKAMFVVNLSSIKKYLERFRWSGLAGGMLLAWLATYVVTASAGETRVETGTNALLADQPRDFLRMSETSWLSPANVFRRASAVTEGTDQAPAAPGSHFRALTRIYGAATEHDPAESTAVDADEPMPVDEVARFHQMETHLPIRLARITSEFGDRPNPLGNGHVFHRGIDLAAPVGTPVYAVAAGTVIRAGSDRAYGNVVVINHHNGYRTLYAHNSMLLVKAGARVTPGQQIAKVGTTGHSTGPHLHFEIHRSGQRVDPGPYLAAL